MYAWALWRGSATYGLSFHTVLTWLAPTGLLVLVGTLFIIGSSHHRELPPRTLRNRYLAVLLIPLVLGLVLAVRPMLRVRSRVDDGYRGARIIEGTGFELVWAPEGPGWVTGTTGPTWNEVALYGLEPVGFEGKENGRQGLCTRDTPEGCATQADLENYNICRYLSDDGTTLMKEPQGYWRLPSVDELVGSLVYHGENAGCTWSGEPGRQPCEFSPDKETPLWNPQAPIIYLWTATEASRDEAYYVAYNGTVSAGAKYTGLGSRAFRCVRTRP